MERGGPKRKVKSTFRFCVIENFPFLRCISKAITAAIPFAREPISSLRHFFVLAKQYRVWFFQIWILPFKTHTYVYAASQFILNLNIKKKYFDDCTTGDYTKHVTTVWFNIISNVYEIHMWKFSHKCHFGVNFQSIII